jgi:hypothetical protein
VIKALYLPAIEYVKNANPGITNTKAGITKTYQQKRQKKSLKEELLGNNLAILYMVHANLL